MSQKKDKEIRRLKKLLIDAYNAQRKAAEAIKMVLAENERLKEACCGNANQSMEGVIRTAADDKLETF